ncbi:MAG: EAL domain-containing protein [Alphaproteobacteria bacterium]|nr:EAL domain-containing protein [Alphaproteobacteria bacterium]
MAPIRRKIRKVELELSILRGALAGSGDLAYAWDLESDSIDWLGRVDEIFGISAANSIAYGREFHRRINPDDLLIRRRALAGHIATGAPFECEYRIRAENGDIVWVHERGAARLSTAGEPEHLSGTLRVVTGRKADEARLEYQANYDETTGHFSQARLREALDQALVYSRRYGVEGAFLSIGIDSHSIILEAYGGATVDAVILALGQRIERVVRESDVIGRMASDSFGVVISNCPPDQLTTVADKLLAACDESPVQTASGPVHLKISIGGVVFPELGQSAHDAIAQADLARREAKVSPGASYASYHYSEKQQQTSRHKVEVAEQVMRALKTGNLVFAYQPIVTARGHQVNHYECLLRKIESNGSVTAAAAFMPIVERLGLIREIDRFVLETAVGQLREHTDVSFAINVSALTASDRSWLRLLFALLRNEGDVAERLVIEITETMAMQDIEETANFVAQVRDLGCGVALDDFGAGHTSFRHLKALAVNTVKIDGAFVQGVSENLDNQLFVRTLLGLAKGFNLATIAECVETEADASTLTEQGVDLLQGYFFGKPSIEPPWSAGKKPALALIKNTAIG